MPTTARPLRWLFSGLLAAAVLVTAPGGAAAQEDGADADMGMVAQATNPVQADFKGIIGLGLIGTELGFVVPALAGARDPWFYIVFPILGAGGGGTAGYFLLEEGAGDPELAVASLALGMALVIPAMGITLAAPGYAPETDERHGRLPPNVRAAREAGPGLVRISERGLMLAPPGVAATTNVSVAESLRTGVPRKSELRVPVVSGRF